MTPALVDPRPEVRSPVPASLGRLASLPESLLIDRILPHAVEKGFLPGFQYASRDTLAISLKCAQNIMALQPAPPSGSTPVSPDHLALVRRAQAYGFERIMREPQEQRAELLVAVGHTQQARFWHEQDVVRHGIEPSMARSQALLTLGKFDNIHTGYEAAVAAYDAALQAQPWQDYPTQRVANSITLQAEVLRAEALIGLSVQPERTEDEAMRLRARARLGLFRADVDSRSSLDEVAFWLGESYRLDARLMQPQQTRQLNASERYFKQAISLTQTFGLARTRLADVQRAQYLANHSPLEGHGAQSAQVALHDCQEAQEDCLLCTTCRMAMADASWFKQDTAQVYRHYLTAHLDNPSAPGPNLGLALVLQMMPPVYQEFKLHEARARATLLADPRNVGAHSLLGMSLARRGEKQEARLRLRFVVNNVPDCWDVREALAKIELEVGQYNSALALYQQLLAALPAHGPATLGIARAYRGKDLRGEASAYYCKAFAYLPTDGAARLEAKVYLSWVAVQNPRDVAQLHLLAGLHLKDRELEKAGAIYRQIVELAPTDAEGLAGRARVYRYRQMWREAYADYSAAVAAAAKPDKFKFELVLMLLQIGQLTDARLLATDIAQRAGITDESIPASEVKWMRDLGSIIAKHRHQDSVIGILRRAYEMHRSFERPLPVPSSEASARATAPHNQDHGLTLFKAFRPAPPAPARPLPASRAVAPPAPQGEGKATAPRGARPPRSRLSPLSRHVLTAQHRPS